MLGASFTEDVEAHHSPRVVTTGAYRFARTRKRLIPFIY
jgi:hypothetical protein